MLIVDTRDRRLISPHQGWSAYEISANSQEDPNTRTESRRVDRASAGYYFSMFCCYTLKTFKIVVSINMETAKAYQAPQYGPEVLEVLSQEAFQPVSWPTILSDETPLIADLKLRTNGRLFAHFVFKGFRSDENMTVTQSNLIDEALNMMHQGDLDVLEVQTALTIFAERG